MLISLCVSSLKIKKIGVFFALLSTGGKHTCAHKGCFLLLDTKRQKITAKEFKCFAFPMG